MVAGSRADFHNLAGTDNSLPRINFKYDFSPKTILRLFLLEKALEQQIFFWTKPTVFCIKQNCRNFTKRRKNIRFKTRKSLGIMEKSLQQDFKLFAKKTSWITDFFRTDFQNQVLVDLENPQKIVFYNLDGKSFANSLQCN